MKFGRKTLRLILLLALVTALALPANVMAQEPQPNDPKPEALPFEPEPAFVPKAISVLESVPAEPVVPACVEDKLGGECIHYVSKTVTLPPTPPRLDLVLMVDLSGSYNDDLPNIKGKAPNIFDGVRAGVADSYFGLTTFVDYPFLYWGDPTTNDYAYRLDQALTGDRTTWLNAVNAMGTRAGADFPESQYVALYQAATGAGQTVDGYTIPAGQDPAWRDEVTHVIAITTDAAFHNRDDGGGPFPYPGPSRDDTVAALNAENIKVIAIKALGASTQMDDIAGATGGAVATTSSTSAEIVEAILGALEELTFTVTPVPRAGVCDGLEFSFSPEARYNVQGGQAVMFDETISVAEGTAEGSLIECKVDFFADETLIGTQDVNIDVNESPTAEANGPYLVAVDSSIPLDGFGSDPDGDSLSYAWTAPAGTFNDASLEDPLYTAGSEAGIFELSLTVTDPCGAEGTDSASVVVYDPSAGFVTGGGWIYSQPGAYVPDPLLEGNATFGFVSKYKKGATVPTGNTEFQFHAGDLNFHSSSYEWLVITGSNYARFKGEGLINGDGPYKFMLWAGDGEPDTFRIKIWEEVGELEEVVYDNGFDQALESGSIIIHTGSDKVKEASVTFEETILLPTLLR